MPHTSLAMKSTIQVFPLLLLFHSHILLTPTKHESTNNPKDDSCGTFPPTGGSSLDGILPLYEELQYADRDEAFPPATAMPADVTRFHTTSSCFNLNNIAQPGALRRRQMEQRSRMGSPQLTSHDIL